MKLKISHILALVVAVVVFMGCSCGKSKVIPRGKMAEIYVEMLLADQWLAENSRYRTQADTSLVYEPIFNKFGYDTDDYRVSVEHYMKDPERYSRILRKSTEILEKRLVELGELKAIEDRIKSIVPYEIDQSLLYFVRSRDRLWMLSDSVYLEIDSLTRVYKFVFTHSADSLYDGLRLRMHADSTSVEDSLLLSKPTKSLVPASADSTKKTLSKEVTSRKKVREGFRLDKGHSELQ